jgi:hypothetical protein
LNWPIADPAWWSGVIFSLSRLVVVDPKLGVLLREQVGNALQGR